MWLDVIPLWPLTAIATVGAGAPLRLALLGRLRLTRPETLAWDFLLGSAAIGYAVMAVGYLGGLTTAFAWSLLGAGLVLGVAELRATGLPHPARSARWDVRFLHLLTGLALLWQAWGCLTPAFGGDALNYHLGAPRDWIDAGRIVDSPLRFQSAIPVHHTMIYTWCLLLGGDVLCKLTQTAQLAVALVLIAASGRRLGGRAAGALAACLAVMSITGAWYHAPVMVRSDLTALLFCAGAVWGLVRILTRPSGRWAVAVGVAAGLAVATKYSALMFLIVPGAVALPMGLALVRVGLSRVLRLTALATLAGAVTLSPWLAREWITTGDPLYPILSEVLTIDPDYASARDQMRSHQAWHAPREAPTAAQTLWRSAKRRLRDVAVEGDFLHMMLPLLALAALIAGPGRIRALGVFAIVAEGIFVAAPVGELGRFFLITSPVTASLAAWLLTALGRHTRAAWAVTSAAGLLGAAVMAQHQVSWSRQAHVHWFGRPAMTRDSARLFLLKRCPEVRNALPVCEWADAHLPDDARILCVNHPYAYHVPRRHWTRGRWNVEIFDWLIARRGSPEAVTDALRERGITHVLRVGERGEFEIDQRHWRWEEENTEFLFQVGDARLFALRQ